jgi:hypothetical protein
LLAQAEAADEAEDLQYGDQRGDELPEELRRRETRLAKIKEAKKVLEQRARDKAAAEGKSAAEAKPEDKDQYNFTDPESRILKGADGIVQGYNAQAAVEPTLLLIVGQSVTEAANDKQQLKPMTELIEQQSGSVRKRFWPTTAIVPRRTWSTWNRPRNRSAPSRGSLRRASKSMASIACRPSAVRCRKARPGLIE